MTPDTGAVCGEGGRATLNLLAHAILAGNAAEAVRLDPRCYADDGALYDDAEWRDAALYYLETGDDGDLSPMLRKAGWHERELRLNAAYARGSFDASARHPDHFGGW